MSIARGYEPVARLDTNIMASRRALSKMRFPIPEIDKLDAVAKARKHFVKRSKELAKPSKEGKGESDKGSLAPAQDLMCDVCGNPACLSCVKRTSPEQEASIPSEWAPFALRRFGFSGHNDYRAYVTMPPGIVIDYQRGRLYVICGNCQVVLGLTSTEFGILIHGRTEPLGHGFVDLDRVERLVQMYRAHRSTGSRIDCLIDYDVAIHMGKLWERQPE